MTMCCHASNLCKKNSPGAVHIDGTLRPQVLTKKYNPEYYDLLLKYYKLTKIPLLINTSFNLHEEPIVTSPEQAYRSFVESKIDALVLNKYLILKKNNA
jgi:carbamoyltransferase